MIRAVPNWNAPHIPGPTPPSNYYPYAPNANDPQHNNYTGYSSPFPRVPSHAIPRLTPAQTQSAQVDALRARLYPNQPPNMIGNKFAPPPYINGTMSARDSSNIPSSSYEYSPHPPPSSHLNLSARSSTTGFRPHMNLASSPPITHEQLSTNAHISYPNASQQSHPRSYFSQFEDKPGINTSFQANQQQELEFLLPKTN
jgi:hypothetical protein